MKKIECVFPTHQLQQVRNVLMHEGWRSASILNVYDGDATDFEEIGRGQALPTKCRFELLVEENDINELKQSILELSTSDGCMDLLVTNVDSSLLIVPMSAVDRDDAR